MIWICPSLVLLHRAGVVDLLAVKFATKSSHS